MTTTERMENLLARVKTNAIITHDEDDELLRSLVAAALDYARTYQKLERRAVRMPPTTEQAVIILATHWYESRDGSTGGFFTDTAAAGERVWQTVHRLLALNKNIEI